MKYHLTMLITLSALLFLSCGSNKQNTDSAAEETSEIEVPSAEVPLSPGVIEASFDILKVETQDNTTVITAKIVEVTGYGSSTEPVAPNTEIRFSLPNDLSESQFTRFKQGATVSGKLSKVQQGMSMNTSNTSGSAPWTLISVNQ